MSATTVSNVTDPEIRKGETTMGVQEQLESAHRGWLNRFDPRHLKAWENSLAADPEAALCEAAVRDVMQGFGFVVEPAADLLGRGPEGAVQRPDFRCSNGTSAFYVEVSNISIAHATKQTNLPHPEEFKIWRSYGRLTKAVFGKATGKATQCGQDLPTLLAVGTFHAAASRRALDRWCANSLLTGEPMITWNVDTRTGASLGDAYQSTNLTYASFIKPGDCSIVNARTSISGILLCGFGILPASIIGVLHPQADRPFDPKLLPRIPFGEVRIDHVGKRLVTVWPDTEG
jgi:hypothetical protein